MVDYREVSQKLLETLNTILPNIENVEESEGLLLSHDHHVITVKTGFQPKEVFVSITDEDIQTCGGDLSSAKTSILPDGFVLYAHIRSDKATVRWITKP